MGRTRPAASGPGGARAAGAPAAAAAPPPEWVEWVEGCAYLAENVWDKRVPREVLARFRPPSRQPPPTAAQARSAKVRAGRIRDAAHPAFGQCGLFAARKLAPGGHVCDYRVRGALRSRGARAWLAGRRRCPLGDDSGSAR